CDRIDYPHFHSPPSVHRVLSALFIGGAEFGFVSLFGRTQICPLASVTCLLQAYGCNWEGPRSQRRRHLETCSMWEVKC
ncbi:unnamed protein product, partial [Hapterophycus canaliculatus]